MRVRDTTPWPHAMTFSAARDPDSTRAEGEWTAKESRALGVHWVMFPVADVNNNADNPVIHIRSYGENPADVSAHVRAFIEGAKGGGDGPFRRVLTTAKHFPGHGDTAVDSHLNMPVLAADRERLERLELAPFRAAIEAGVDLVMTAHVAVPALENPEVPATLSPAVLTTLLREQLGFNGMISTDALEMGGISKGFGVGEAAVMAVEAGADILLMPPDPNAAIRAVAAAVRQGRIQEARINQSVGRILAAKVRLGLDRRRVVNVEAAAESIDPPEAAARAQRVTDRAVTLIRNEGHMLPLRAEDKPCFVVLSENRYTPQGALLAEQLKKRSPASPLAALDPEMSAPEVDGAMQALGTCALYAVAAFAGAPRYRDDQPLPGEFVRLMESLTSGAPPVALASLGQPYLIRSFPRVKAYFTTYTPAPPAELSAAKAFFGEIACAGKLPVAIPGIAPYGAGLTLVPRPPAQQ
jgi:beta-N-acetylhexosaminidase